jgi:hypothetical protein
LKPIHSIFGSIPPGYLKNGRPESSKRVSLGRLADTAEPHFRAGRYLGVTPPISVAESTPREREVTVTLMEELRRQNTFESEEEARTRYVVDSC